MWSQGVKVSSFQMTWMMYQNVLNIQTGMIRRVVWLGLKGILMNDMYHSDPQDKHMTFIYTYTYIL